MNNLEVEKAVREWLRSRSCWILDPEECQKCTRAFLDAIRVYGKEIKDENEDSQNKNTLKTIMKESFSWISDEELNSPQFEAAGRIHDWRNYVPDNLHHIWDGLTEETKLVAFLIAENIADKEDWD